MKHLSLGVPAKSAGLAVLTGLVSAASYPPLALWPLSVVAVVLFLLLLCDQPPRSAFNLAFLYGLAFGSGTLYWFFNLFGALALGLIGLFALYFALLALLIALCRHSPPVLRAALVALFIVAIEWLRGDAWYLRFPWYTVPHALASEPVAIAPVRWLGTYGFSAALWFVAAWGAFGRPWIWGAFLLVPLTALLLPPVEAPDRRALLVQAEPTSLIELMIPRISTERVDLVVLPELAFPDPYQQALKSPRGPAVLARKVQAPVVFGALDMLKDGGFQNVAVVIDVDGTLIGTFPKQRPVPLFDDGRPGDRRPVFPRPEGTLGVAVCYDFDAPEIAGSLVEQGATVLVAPTFDARSWGWTQHVNHELLLRLRAVENDRWILRAVSSGRSEAVDPHGVPSVEGVPLGENETVIVGYRHQQTQPLGGRMYVLGPMAAIGTLLFLLGTLLPWRRLVEGKTHGTGLQA